jgi:two-component system, NtrC family, response regulator AtoC
MPTPTPTRHILVADDVPISRHATASILETAGYRVTATEDGQAAWEVLQTMSTDVLITDLVMPRLDGMDLLRLLDTLPERPACILLTVFGTLESAVQATKLGAYGYLAKPPQADRILHIVGKALEERQAEQERQRLQRESWGRAGLDQLLGESALIRALRRLIEDLADSEVRVLVLGKSGTGKERVARALHAVSPRRDRPFMAINCGGLSAPLLESELFGHVRGAFTGAVADRPGMLVAAQGGTLFLDEIGEMPLPMQVALLRALEQGVVRPVGAERETRIDVRVIAATNRDLPAEVAAGRFREDLYYRLNVVTLTVPALAERPDDIPLLAQHFLAQVCAQTQRPPLRLTNRAMDLLKAYAWPGNVRELHNVLERACVLAQGPEITPQYLPPHFLGLRALGRHRAALAPMDLESLKWHAIRQALALSHGNRAAAARLLEISERSLYRKLKEQPMQAGREPIRERDRDTAERRSTRPRSTNPKSPRRDPGTRIANLSPQASQSTAPPLPGGDRQLSSDVPGQPSKEGHP